MEKYTFCPACQSELSRQETESKFCDSCNYCILDDEIDALTDEEIKEILYAGDFEADEAFNKIDDF